MDDTIRSVTWEAPEHTHIEKSSDWYWALGIIAVAGGVTAIVLGNLLFGAVILLGAVTVILVAARTPRVIPFAVTSRGVRIDNELFPYSSLESFCIDEENPDGPQLIVKSKKFFAPLLVIPLPEDHLDEIDDLISVRLTEEELEEPFSHKLLEFFGF